MDKLEHLELLNSTFLQDRPTMLDNNSDIKVVLRLLLGEVQEAIESDENGLPSELADVMCFLLTAFRVIGADMFEETREKIAYNTLRYDHKLFKDGDFEQSRKQVKANEIVVYKAFYLEDL